MSKRLPQHQPEHTTRHSLRLSKPTTDAVIPPATTTVDQSFISMQHAHDFSRVSTRSAGSKSEAPGPFSPGLNAFLTDAFQRPLSAITVSRQADTENKQLGAVANTQGQHISLSSSVTENPQDSKSMEIIAHEVSHALADAEPASLLSQSDSPVERKADVAGKSFAQAVSVDQAGLQQPLPIASGQGAVVNRYKIGSMISDPVHEAAMLLSLKIALRRRKERRRAARRVGVGRAPHNLPLTGNVDLDAGGGHSSSRNRPMWRRTMPTHKPSTLFDHIDPRTLPDESQAKSEFDAQRVDPHLQQFLRGVTWADDPDGDLYKDDQTTERSIWGQITAAAKHGWYGKLGHKPSRASGLTARSHYGDLQFMHSMANKRGELPQVTNHRILEWAEFNIRLARGEINPATSVGQHPYLRNKFPQQATQSISELYGYPAGRPRDIRQRALGILTHLIQDSFAEGHVQRTSAPIQAPPGPRPIRQFHDYGSQSSHKHGELDEFGNGRKLKDAIAATPGLQEAIDKSAEVMVRIDRGDNTKVIMKYLTDEVFVLDRRARRAGPGRRFQR